MSSTDQIITVEIHYSDAIEWLKNRQQIDNDCQLHKVQDLVDEFNELVQTEHLEVPFNFNQCCYNDLESYFNTLIKERDSSKSLFGSYNDKILHLLDQILRSYKKHNLYLCDLLLYMKQLNNITIPSLIHHSKDILTSIESLSKKIHNCKNSIQLSHNKTLKDLEEWTIDIQDVTNDSKMMDSIYQTSLKISEHCQLIYSLLHQDQFSEILHYYQAFLTYIQMKKELVEIQSTFPSLSSLSTLELGSEEYLDALNTFIHSEYKESYYESKKTLFFSNEHTLCRSIEDPSLRSNILQELHFLLGFYRERLNQYMDNKVYNSTDIHKKNILNYIQNYNTTQLQKDIQYIQDLIDALSSTSIPSYIYIYQNQSYVQKILQKIHKDLEKEEQLQNTQNTLNTNYSNLQKKYQSLTNDITNFKQQLHTITDQIQEEITKLFKNSSIILIGNQY